MKKIFFLTIVCAGLVFLCTACGNAKTEGGLVIKNKRKAVLSSQELQLAAPSEGDTVASFETDYGVIRAVLYPQYAPMAVENFTALANQGYYNGLSFHRVVQDFVIQSGDATGTGTGGASVWNNAPYPIEVSDMLHHYSGALGMAHADGDSAGNLSQFYIVQTPQNSIDKTAAETLTSRGMRAEVVDAYRSAGGAPYLDNLYTVFGQVYEGMELVDAIGDAPADESGAPETPIIIRSVTVSTYTAAANSTAASGTGVSGSTAVSPAA